MAGIPLLPDESPLVTQALRRVLAAIKQNPAKTTVASTKPAAPTVTEWADVTLTHPDRWSVDRPFRVRKEGAFLRFRGRLTQIAVAFPPDESSVIATLSDTYRPSVDLEFLMPGDRLVRLSSATGDLIFSEQIGAVVIFDQVVVPL